MLRLGWFSTGRGEGSRGLLSAIQGSIHKGELSARIEFVFTNRGPGDAEGSDQFIQMVRGYGIPLIAFSSSRFQKERGGSFNDHRAEYDGRMIRLLDGFDVDICVMAGYMLVVSPEVCRRFNFINVHPALPGGPKGKWQDVIWKLIDDKATETGAMVHLVTETVDEGPPLSYCSFPIVGGAFDPLWREIRGKSLDQLKAEQGEDCALFKMIRQEGVRREQPLLLETLIAIAKGQIKASGGLAAGAKKAAIKPLLMNDQVEKRLRAKS